MRFLRAYGPDRAATIRLEVKPQPDSRLKPPLEVSVTNGYLLEGPTTRSTVLDLPGSIEVRYAADNVDGPNRTSVTVQESEHPTASISFLPADVARSGRLPLPTVGLMVTRGGQTPAASRTSPSPQE